MLEIDEKICFLILGESHDDAFATKQMLKKLGFYNCLHSDNAYEAVKICRSNKIDVIISFENLKDMKGWELIKSIKTSNTIPNIPVFLVSKKNQALSSATLNAFGVYDTLTLPMQEKLFVKSLAKTLSMYANPNSLEYKYTEAKESHISGDFLAAIKYFIHIREETGNTIRSNIGLSQSYLSADDIINSQKAIEDIPDAENLPFPGKLIKIGLVIKLSEDAQALGHILDILGHQEVPAMHLLEVHQLLKQERKLAIELALSEYAINKGHNNIEFDLSVAKGFYLRGEIIQCQVKLREIQKAHGDTVEGLNLLGVCLRKSDKFEKALKVYEKIIGITGADSRIFFNMALCCRSKGDIAECTRLLKRCIDIDPDFEKAPALLNQINNTDSSENNIDSKKIS